MPRVVLDENVSLQVVARLEALGYEVAAISKHPERGMHDEAVFALAKGCILVTRDAHFTNPVRFPSAETGGILFITHGNLRGRDEAELVERFLKEHQLENFTGHLAFLSPAGFRIR